MRYTVLRTEVFTFYVDASNESYAEELVSNLDSVALVVTAIDFETEGIEVIIQDEPPAAARFVNASGEIL